MRALIGIVFLLLAGSVGAQERLSGTNVDVRLGIALKAPEAAVLKLIPDGWEMNSPTTGPGQGMNLSLTLLEQVSSQDAQGNAIDPIRGVAVGIPVRRKGTDVTGNMVVAGLFTPKGVPGAYGVYVPANVEVERKQRSDGDGKTLIEERWIFKGVDGDTLEAQIQYARGATTRAKTESKVFSGARPDFYRIYRVDAVSDVARSAATGVDRVSAIALKVSGKKLAALFDGTEKIVSITSIPSYSRQVFLTGP